MVSVVAHHVRTGADYQKINALFFIEIQNLMRMDALGELKIVLDYLEFQMKINKMTREQLEEFHNALGMAFELKFIDINSDLADAVLKLINSKLMMIAPIDLELRPMCLNKRIILNYDIGTTDKSPLSQILCAVHEVQHSVEVRKVDPEIRWYIEYFSPDSKFRSNQELKARISELEVMYWYAGIVPALDMGEGYLLSRASLKLADSAYKNHVADIARQGRGACYQDSSRVAIEILDGMGVVPL
jgi:hypothetical protein